MKIERVADQACPRCGAYWGHPNSALDFPNRVKVDRFWRCYNPDCTCAYYLDGVVVEDELSEEESQALAARISEEVKNMNFTVIDYTNTPKRSDNGGSTKAPGKASRSPRVVTFQLDN